jgi:hypothetical protein
MRASPGIPQSPTNSRSKEFSSRSQNFRRNDFQSMGSKIEGKRASYKHMSGEISAENNIKRRSSILAKIKKVAV